MSTSIPTLANKSNYIIILDNIIFHGACLQNGWKIYYWVSIACAYLGDNGGGGCVVGEDGGGGGWGWLVSMFSSDENL